MWLIIIVASVAVNWMIRGEGEGTVEVLTKSLLTLALYGLISQIF